MPQTAEEEAKEEGCGAEGVVEEEEEGVGVEDMGRPVRSLLVSGRGSNAVCSMGVARRT